MARLFLIAFALLGVAVSARAEPLRLSLADAMALARTNNASVLASETRIRAQEGVVTRERADVLPELSADLSLSRQVRSTETFGFPKDGTVTIDQTIPFDIRYPGLSPSVINDFNLPEQGELLVNETVPVENDIGESTDPYTLFDGRLRLDVPLLDVEESREIDAARATLDQSRTTSTAESQSVMTQVAILYLKALASAQEVGALQARLALNESRVELRADQQSTGMATDLDVKSDKLTVSMTRRELREAEKKLADALRGLKRLLNVPASVQLELTDELAFRTVPTPPMEDALAIALERRPDHLAQKAAERAAELRRDASKADRYPTLRALGNYGRQGGGIDDTVEAWFIGAFVQIPIFDSFRRSGVIVQREAQLAEARLLTEDGAAAIRADLESSREALSVAAESIDVATEAVRFAEDVLAQRRDMAKAGRATPLEVNQAQVALAEATFRRMEKVYDYNIAALQWFRSLGRIEDYLELAP